MGNRCYQDIGYTLPTRQRRCGGRDEIPQTLLINYFQASSLHVFIAQFKRIKEKRYLVPDAWNGEVVSALL